MNEQGFYRIEEQLRKLEENADWTKAPVAVIREEVEMLRLHLEKIPTPPYLRKNTKER